MPDQQQLQKAGNNSRNLFILPQFKTFSKTNYISNNDIT